MKFTVLGSRGVIGSRVTAHLRASGHTVYAPDREDPHVWSRPLGHVIYSIGLTADFRSRPFDTVEAHVSLLARMLRHANFSSFLYLSSTRVYGRADHSTEETTLQVLPQDPSDLYNLSKLMGESICHGCGRPEVRVARLSNVVGGDDSLSDNFLPALVREALSGQITLRSSLSSAKDYIHIDDVAELLPRIALHGRARLYNVASGMQTTHAQWIDRLVALTGCSVEVVPDAATTSFAPIDIDRIRDEFGYQPRPVLDVLTTLIPSRQPSLN